MLLITESAPPHKSDLLASLMNVIGGRSLASIPELWSSTSDVRISVSSTLDAGYSFLNWILLINCPIWGYLHLTEGSRGFFSGLRALWQPPFLISLDVIIGLTRSENTRNCNLVQHENKGTILTHRLASNPTIVEPDDDDVVGSSGDEFDPLAEDETLLAIEHFQMPKARRMYGSSIRTSRKEAARLADPNNGRCLLTKQDEPTLSVQASHLLDQATADKTVGILFSSLETRYSWIQLSKLEQGWGLCPRTLHIDTHINIIFHTYRCVANYTFTHFSLSH